mmetsp:Transcript_88931/g.108780  ORF Transcript_88931/g.108780 Transcript_88931/m.108780 type:complete len:227 (+) Transcript_88931:58-738(+)
MPIGPFVLRFQNARLEKLTNRVMCLAGIAIVVLFLRFFAAFFIPTSLLQEFHTNESQEYTSSPVLKFGVPVLGLLIGLAIPCCGYCGARENNRPAICCFTWCNCILGTLQVLGVILCIIGAIALGLVTEKCKPGTTTDAQLIETCQGIMEGCKYMKSDHFDLHKYEGCYDHMASQMSTAMGFLGLGGALACCISCLSYASCYYGRQLHSAMEHQPICVDSSDSEGA